MYGGDGDGVMNVMRRVCRSIECMEESMPEMVIECFACFTLLLSTFAGIYACIVWRCRVSTVNVCCGDRSR